MESGQTNNYEIINGRKVIKKHVATIHCSNKLSLLERKISNALLYHAYPSLKKTLVHEISIDQLKRLLNANTRNHKALKDALKKLISTVLEWNLVGDDVPELELEGWNASAILSSVSVTNGIIKYQYSELIKSLIIDPKIYGKINLIIQSRFKSAYSLALYENCARYRGLKYTKNFEFSVFRQLMGVEDGKYEIFRDFNRRVLTPAVTEINICSDIRITPKITRKGRKVIAIKFVLEERPMKNRIGARTTNKNNEENTNIASIAEEFGLKEVVLNSLINKYGKDKVEKAIGYVKSRPKYQVGEINNISGYLISAIENNYNYMAPEVVSQNVLTSAERLELEQKRRKDAELQRKYQNYETNASMSEFEKLDAETKTQVLGGFEEYTESTGSVYLSLYKKEGINNPLVAESLFLPYLKAVWPEVCSGVCSIDEFRREMEGVEELQG